MDLFIQVPAGIPNKLPVRYQSQAILTELQDLALSTLLYILKKKFILEFI